jgi:predicted cupin superfamily sugar epimerase
VKSLEMNPHPEGGWYRETYRSLESVQVAGLPTRFTGERSFCTAIYFLLEYPQFSGFHRIKSDEMWHFYEGSALNVFVIDLEGNFDVIKMGPDIEQGESFQAVVKAGCWFASQPAGDEDGSRNGELFSLVGCTVSPGFDFKDFEMAKTEDLIKEYPQHAEWIKKYCRP